MKKSITVLEGDGIGPEVIREAIKVLDSITCRYSHRFTYHYHLIGAAAIDACGQPLPEATIQSCYDTDAVLLGAIGDPKFDNDPSAPVRPEQGLLSLRKNLQLYANIRPIQLYPELEALSPLKKEKLNGTDMIIIRELTGGIYFGKKEKGPDNSFASDICYYTRQEIEQITEKAFHFACNRNKKLTLVDKANVLETSRLWRHIAQEKAQQFPDVQVDYLFVDNAAMQLILHPQQFDVLLTENMFGDILSDEASVLSGSLGLLPSSSLGKDTALFEPVHGSYPQVAGKNIANPIGAILSAAMLLEHFDLKEEAAEVRLAVRHVIRSGIVTQDLNREVFYGTNQVGNAVSSYILNKETADYNFQNIRLGQSTII